MANAVRSELGHLELTESMLMKNSSASLERLHAIRALAFKSPSTTSDWILVVGLPGAVPVTHIKIDRSFVTPLDDPGRGAGVVHAIVEIGRALGLTTVAEG